MNSSVPRLLERLKAGDQSAFDPLVGLMYDDLHRIAKRHLSGERIDHTLQATALVNEVYLKLAGGSNPHAFSGEVHFLAVASRVMRQILVDYARARSAKKRAGNGEVSLASANLTTFAVSGEAGLELLDLILLDTALDELAREDAPLARLIEMRYFGGMTAEQSAEATGLSPHVVRHDLRLAQAWLKRRLSERE